VPGSFEPPPDLLACHLERVPVGDYDRRVVAETLPENTGDGGERAPPMFTFCVSAASCRAASMSIAPI
jgi:hypothetical protein